MTDLDSFKDIPGYKAILKSVLKSQIQLLLEQLSSHTGEESIILTANLHDGALSHLGSSTGKGFIEGRDELKSQFLGFCLKTHHKKQKQESRPTPYQRPEASGSVKRPGLGFKQQSKQSRTSQESVQIERTGPGGDYNQQVVAVPDDTPSLKDMSQVAQKELTGTDKNEGVVKVERAESSDSNSEPSNVLTPSVKFPPALEQNHTQSSANPEDDATNSADGDNEDTVYDNDDSAAATSIKIEPITENEMELEITGVEPGTDTWGQGQVGYAAPGTSGDESINQSSDAAGYKNKNTEQSEELLWSDEEIQASEEVPALEGSSLEGDKVTEPETIKKSCICEVCAKQFSSKSRLKKHSLVHEDVIKCKTCRIAFATDEELAEHKQLKHSRLFVCEQCGQRFSVRSSLTTHMRAKHYAEDQLKCPYDKCGKTFGKRTLYEDHLNIHTNAKPYQCSKCQKTFASRYSQSEHFKICISGIKYACQICAREFSTKGGLHNHSSAVHQNNRYVCRCGKIYRYHTGLANHKHEKNH